MAVLPPKQGYKVSYQTWDGVHSAEYVSAHGIDEATHAVMSRLGCAATHAGTKQVADVHQLIWWRVGLKQSGTHWPEGGATKTHDVHAVNRAEAIRQAVVANLGWHYDGETHQIPEPSDLIEGIPEELRKPKREGPDPQVLIKEQCDDAQLWALAFSAQFDLPESTDGAVIGWFANAIETAKSKIRNASMIPDLEEPVEYDRDEECVPCVGETREAELSLEDLARFQQRNADKAAVIELILSYRNPASDEEKMRQIRVVMD